ncbi:MAG: hypothetical protein KAV00_11955 [Phycisphaerae bacterium]|nr:hypothetical protein [Phycisphaerae bacterium]
MTNFINNVSLGLHGQRVGVADTPALTVRAEGNKARDGGWNPPYKTQPAGSRRYRKESTCFRAGTSVTG